jgi:hypothetical protein
MANAKFILSAMIGPEIHKGFMPMRRGVASDRLVHWRRRQVGDLFSRRYAVHGCEPPLRRAVDGPPGAEVLLPKACSPFLD